MGSYEGVRTLLVKPRTSNLVPRYRGEPIGDSIKCRGYCSSSKTTPVW